MISYFNFKDKRYLTNRSIHRERFPTKSLETSSITIVQINNPSQSIGYTSTDREIYTLPPPSLPYRNPQYTAIQCNTIKQTHLTRQSKTHRTIWKYGSRLAMVSQHTEGDDRNSGHPPPSPTLVVSALACLTDHKIRGRELNGISSTSDTHIYIYIFRDITLLFRIFLHIRRRHLASLFFKSQYVSGNNCDGIRMEQ